MLHPGRSWLRGWDEGVAGSRNLDALRENRRAGPFLLKISTYERISGAFEKRDLAFLLLAIERELRIRS